MAALDSMQRRLGKKGPVDPALAQGVVNQQQPVIPSTLPGYQTFQAPNAASNQDLVKNITSLYAQSDQPSKHPVFDAIGRSLTGAARGVQASLAAPASGVDPGLGGVAAGLTATGQSFEAENQRRLAQGEPYRKILQTIAEKDVEQRVKQPYEQANKTAEEEKQRRLFDYEQSIKMRDMKSLLNLKDDKTPPPTPEEVKLASQSLWQKKQSFDYSPEELLGEVASQRRIAESLKLRKGNTPAPPAGDPRAKARAALGLQP